MITAKYDGKCAICKKPITVGRDLYDVDQKKNFHEDCLNKRDLFSANEALELAERLHFIDARALDQESTVIPEVWRRAGS